MWPKGYDRDEVEERTGLGEGWDEEETQSRHEEIDGGHPTARAKTRLVRVVEAYIALDMHETGIATMHRVLAIGQDNFVVDVEPVDRSPFVVASPIRMPHRLIGQALPEWLRTSSGSSPSRSAACWITCTSKTTSASPLPKAA